MKLAPVLLTLLALAPAARADSFAPVGLWRGEASGDFLLVWGEGFCSMAGSVVIAGPCTWASADQEGDREGTLSLTAERTPGPQSLDLAVRWIDAETILVGTERFERRG